MGTLLWLISVIYVRTIGERTLYVRVFGGVRGYVIFSKSKTVLPTLHKKRGPAVVYMYGTNTTLGALTYFCLHVQHPHDRETRRQPFTCAVQR